MDVQHLWFGRRAATRAKTSLQAAVYVKALRRKDFSGTTKKDEEKAAEGPEPTDKKGKKEAKEAKAKADDANKEADKKAAADVGKIVQLMSAGQSNLPELGARDVDVADKYVLDSNQVAMSFAWLYMLYSAPFEIAIASYMLYQCVTCHFVIAEGAYLISLRRGQIARMVRLRWIR